MDSLSFLRKVYHIPPENATGGGNAAELDKARRAGYNIVLKRTIFAGETQKNGMR